VLHCELIVANGVDFSDTRHCPFIW